MREVVPFADENIADFISFFDSNVNRYHFFHKTLYINGSIINLLRDNVIVLSIQLSVAEASDISPPEISYIIRDANNTTIKICHSENDLFGGIPFMDTLYDPGDESNQCYNNILASDLFRSFIVRRGQSSLWNIPEIKTAFDSETCLSYYSTHHSSTSPQNAFSLDVHPDLGLLHTDPTNDYSPLIYIKAFEWYSTSRPLPQEIKLSPTYQWLIHDCFMNITFEYQIQLAVRDWLQEKIREFNNDTYVRTTYASFYTSLDHDAEFLNFKNDWNNIESHIGHIMDDIMNNPNIMRRYHSEITTLFDTISANRPIYFLITTEGEIVRKQFLPPRF